MMRRYMEKTVALFSWMMTAVFFGVVLIFIGYLLKRGLPALEIDLVFGGMNPADVILGKSRVFDGLYPAIVGTLLLICLSTLLAIPLGLGAGIYLAEYASEQTRKRFGFFFDILTGIPSIVIGLFGFSLAVFLHTHFSHRITPCLLISAMSLAFLVLPYLIRSTQVSLENLPKSIRQSAPALGATRFQNIFYVLLPYSLSDIMSGIILSIGRCAEDTAVIMLTGVVATAGIPSSLFAQYEALPFYIYYVSSQYADHTELSRGYGACLILLGICAVLFVFSGWVKKGLAYRALYRM